MLPPGARPLLAVGAGLALVGGAGRFLAEQARIDAPLGTLLASTTGQGLLRLATGVVVTAIATWFLATAPEGERVDTWRFALVGATAGLTLLLHVDVGHAAGPSPLRTLNLLIQWLHVLAVGAWIGGLVWLLAWLRGRERPEQAEAVVRFSKLAAPVLGLVAVTGLSRALHLAGGWDGLLHSSYGRLLDVKVLLFLGLVALGALNRYRVVPALAAGARGLGHLRRNVRGEVALAACILTVTAVLSQLPPGKFVVQQASAKPPAPPSVQVEGSDFATAVRINLTASPGTPGPNTFTAKVTDYDSGEDWPATRVSLRFTPRGNPDVGASTLELSKGEDGLWTGQGSQLSIAGTWSVVSLVEGSGPAVTVPLELKTRTAPQAVKVSEAPGQPTLYTITLAAGGTLQAYIDPGRPGPNTVHFTYFNQSGDEQPADKASARMTGPSGKSEALTLVRLGPGHFAANVDLDPGRVSFAIEATAARVQRGGQFQQVIG
jgi:copper transport protein